MKPMALPLSVVALGIVSPAVLAQGSSDPMTQLRACSQLEGAARLQCLEKLSKDIAPPPAAPPVARPPATDEWLISETTSPVDYTPIVVATTRALGERDLPIAQLSIQCRSGRTELVFAGPAVVQADAVSISLHPDAGPPVTVAAVAPISGGGVAARGDVVALLRALPEGGELIVRIATRRGAAHEGRFSLQGLAAVRDRVSAACQWPRN